MRGGSKESFSSSSRRRTSASYLFAGNLERCISLDEMRFASAFEDKRPDPNCQTFDPQVLRRNSFTANVLGRPCRLDRSCRGE